MKVYPKRVVPPEARSRPEEEVDLHRLEVARYLRRRRLAEIRKMLLSLLALSHAGLKGICGFLEYLGAVNVLLIVVVLLGVVRYGTCEMADPMRDAVDRFVAAF